MAEKQYMIRRSYDGNDYVHSVWYGLDEFHTKVMYSVKSPDDVHFSEQELVYKDTSGDKCTIHSISDADRKIYYSDGRFTNGSRHCSELIRQWIKKVNDEIESGPNFV